MKTNPRYFISSLLLTVLVLFAAACGSSATETITDDLSAELDARADAALDPAPPAAAAEPTQPTQPTQPTEPPQTAAAPDTPAATEQPAATVQAAATVQPTQPAPTPQPTVAASPPTVEPPTVTVPTAEPPTVSVPTAQPPIAAESIDTSGYVGPRPVWFSVPAGFVPTGFDLQRGDVDVLTIYGNLTAAFTPVCNDFSSQASAAGVAFGSGSCSSSTLQHGTLNQQAIAQTFSSSTAEFVFIGFDLVEGQATTPAPPATTEAPAQSGTISTGIFPDWYQPPVGVIYVSHRDASSSGERQIQTNLVGIDYTTVCNDYRAQAALVGLAPTPAIPCDDDIIRSTRVTNSAGASSRIQDVEDLSYEVLFTFDPLAMAIPAATNGGGGSIAQPVAPAPAPAAPTPAPTAPVTSDDIDRDGNILPLWFNPSVDGTELGHSIEDGVYTLAAIGEMRPSQNFTTLCHEFERQATAAGWQRRSGDVCGEDVFDGATFVDPVTGFEAKVRNHRGAEITYSFVVAANLSTAEITTIALDVDNDIVPLGFTLTLGDRVVALAESIDDTGAYNSAIQVTGPNGYIERCVALLAQYPGAQVVLGGCDGGNFITFGHGNMTVILEGDVYTFVTR